MNRHFLFRTAFTKLHSGTRVSKLCFTHEIGLAYGLLTTLDPVYGLYTSLVPVLVYSVFGTSKHISIGKSLKIYIYFCTYIQLV